MCILVIHHFLFVYPIMLRQHCFLKRKFFFKSKTQEMVVLIFKDSGNSKNLHNFFCKKSLNACNDYLF